MGYRVPKHCFVYCQIYMIELNRQLSVLYIAFANRAFLNYITNSY